MRERKIMSEETNESVSTEKFEEAFLELVDGNVETALQLITGMFIGLTLEMVKRSGGDSTQQVVIEGGSARNSRIITIHAEGYAHEKGEL